MPFGPSQILLDAEATDGALDARALEVAFADRAALSPDRLLWRGLRANRTAVVSAWAILALLVIAILAPLIVAIFGLSGPNVHNPHTLNSFGLPTGPSFSHPFGVDDSGRDVFVRVLYGARVALLVGIGGAALASVVGTVIGLAGGFYRGWTEKVLMGGVDVFLAFPVVLLGLGIGGASAPGVGTMIFIVALCGFPYMARLVWRRVRALRELEFVLAARGLGASDGQILSREILPSLVGPLIAYSILLIPASILLEAALSYLGAGVRLPTADWGLMISAAGNDILSGNSAWWYLAFPGLALLLTVLVFHLAGTGLLDVLGRRRAR